MKAVFVEAPGFTDAIGEHCSDDEYSRLQHELMEDPTKWPVIPGCNGVRKARFADPKRGRGKRGGSRVLYLFVPEAKRIFMLDIYGKDEKDDLSADDRKVLSKVADELRQDALAAAARRTKGSK